jgi:hypothetical protein
MKLTRLVVIFVGLLFLNGVLTGTASATTVEECQALKRPGNAGGSGYWIPISGWSVRGPS